MALIDDQLLATDPQLLGRVLACLKLVAANVFEESDTTAERQDLVKRIFKNGEAPNLSRSILELAVAKSAKFRSLGTAVQDDDIRQIVTHYFDLFAPRGW